MLKGAGLPQMSTQWRLSSGVTQGEEGEHRNWRNGWVFWLLNHVFKSIGEDYENSRSNELVFWGEGVTSRWTINVIPLNRYLLSTFLSYIRSTKKKKKILQSSQNSIWRLWSMFENHFWNYVWMNKTAKNRNEPHSWNSACHFYFKSVDLYQMLVEIRQQEV